MRLKVKLEPREIDQHLGAGQAFMFALRARKVESVQRQVIYSALWKRFKRKPLSLFYPKKDF